MNTNVTVTGMQIDVHSNSTYLIIGSDDDGNDTLSEIQAVNNITTACNIAAADAHVYPSAYTNTVTNTATAEVPANWYFKVADIPTASASTGSATALTTANFGEYVLHKKVYVTLATGSQQATDLVVTDMTIASNGASTTENATFAPVKVLITSGTAAVELNSTTRSSNTALADTVTDGAIIPLDIWIYYDGNDTNVYTTNIANLDGANINLEFGVTFASDLNP